MEFLMGGCAAVCAGVFTNPLEIIKTRMQLQGELEAKGKHVVHYKNIIHAAYQIVKHEGIISLERGLVPASWVQLIMNGCRLGFYDFGYSRGYAHDKDGNKVFYKCALLSGCGGVTGHYLSNPFYVIKTRVQAESAKAIAVGYQHRRQKTWNALVDIFKSRGIQGLFIGGVAVLPRAFLASSSQILSFVYSKDWLSKHDYFQAHPLLKSFVSSMIGGIAISVVVTPFDLILIRLYNQGTDAQGKGIYYKGYFDCVYKIYKTEGLLAFYKGLGPMYFRLGPHSMLSLTFWDLFKDIYNKYVKNVS